MFSQVYHGEPLTIDKSIDKSMDHPGSTDFRGVASLRSPLLGLLGFFPGRIMLSAFDALKRSERRLSDLLFGSHLEGIRKPPQETKKGKVWNNLTETISLNPNLLEENVCLPWSCRSLLGATMAMHKIPLRCSWSGYPSTAANENHPTSSDLPSNKSRWFSRDFRSFFLLKWIQICCQKWQSALQPQRIQRRGATLGSAVTLKNWRKNMKKHGTIVPQQPMPPVWGFGTQKIIDLPSLSHGFQMVSVPEGPSTELRTSNQCHTPQSESGNQRMVHCTHCGIVVSTVTCGSYLTWPGWGMPPLTQVVPKCRIGTGSKLHHSCHSSYPTGSASQNGNKG